MRPSANVRHRKCVIMAGFYGGFTPCRIYTARVRFYSKRVLRAYTKVASYVRIPWMFRFAYWGRTVERFGGPWAATVWSTSTKAETVTYEGPPTSTAVYICIALTYWCLRKISLSETGVECIAHDVIGERANKAKAVGRGQLHARIENIWKVIERTLFN